MLYMSTDAHHIVHMYTCCTCDTTVHAHEGTNKLNMHMCTEMYIWAIHVAQCTHRLYIHMGFAYTWIHRWAVHAYGLNMHTNVHTGCLCTKIYNLTVHVHRPYM